MTVGELIKHLSNFDDKLEIGGYDHYGEILEIGTPWKCNEGFVVMDIESAGEEPN